MRAFLTAMFNFLRFFERRKAPCPESSSTKCAEGHEESVLSPAERPSEAQRKLVKDSWQALQQDISRVGVIIFVRYGVSSFPSELSHDLLLSGLC